jgi:uncharacterized protein YjbI with pentapeptide repeats
MANEEHVAILNQGVAVWNDWRREHPDIRPDLSLANLDEVSFREADLMQVNFSGACLTGGRFVRANLTEADLVGADLRGADLRYANLSKADLRDASLRGANFGRANLSGAVLVGADLEGVLLVETDLDSTDLTGCHIYGISAWGLKVTEKTKQIDLIITRVSEPKITVDNLEVAQFIYLLLHNERIRGVIDTVTSRAVLILGRFTPGRKKVLDVLREELRKRNRTPIIFDFDQPERKNVADTIKLLAQMARYIIIDLSDPNSAPFELGVISMLGLDSTPVVPLIVKGQNPFPMLTDVLRKPWSTKLITYDDIDNLRRNIDELLIAIAEEKVDELLRSK